MIPTAVAMRKDISQGAKLTYGIIYTRQNGTKPAYASQKNMAFHIGVSERTIRKYLRALIALNLIYQKRFGLTRTNSYWVKDRTKPSSHDRNSTSALHRYEPSGHSNSKGNSKAVSQLPLHKSEGTWREYRIHRHPDGNIKICVDSEWKIFAGDERDIIWK